MSAAKDLFAKAYGDTLGEASIGLFKELRKSQNAPRRLTHKAINISQLNEGLGLHNPEVKRFYLGLSTELALDPSGKSDERINALIKYSLDLCLLMGLSENVYADIMVMACLAIIKGEHHTADALVNVCTTPLAVSKLLASKQRQRGIQGGRPAHEMRSEVLRMAEKRHKEIPYETNEALIDYLLKNIGSKLSDEKQRPPSRSTMRRIIAESTVISKSRLKAGKK